MEAGRSIWGMGNFASLLIFRTPEDCVGEKSPPCYFPNSGLLRGSLLAAYREAVLLFTTFFRHFCTNRPDTDCRRTTVHQRTVRD